MPQTASQIPKLTNKAELADRAIELVQQWLQESETEKASAAASRLAGVLKDPNGLAFAVGFVDGVVRPEDLKVAAKNLQSLREVIPTFLPLPLRGLIALGSLFGVLMPWLVIPIARVALRSMVAHLIIDATDSKLGGALAKLTEPGVELNINLLGEAVLGKEEADKRLAGTFKLLSRSDVNYVSIKVSAATAPHSHWAFNEAVTDIVEKLTPLFELANSTSKKKFINLDMEEYKDLDLTIEVFKKILEKPQLHDLEAGIVLQAYLPDALAAMIDLQSWAANRVENGGAGIKIRVVKGANLPMEQVDAEIHGWPLATMESKQASDTQYKRVLNYALTPEHTKNLRVGVAGHNLFDLAFAWLLASERGCTDGLEIEMLLGMAEGQSRAVKRTTGKLLLYTPVVHPSEFDVAIAYLIRRLEEGASSENFMSGLFELTKDVSIFEREKFRFLSSMQDLDDQIPVSNRVQNRLTDKPAKIAGFENSADTDSSIAANREWAYQIMQRAKTSELGVKQVAKSNISTQKELDKMLSAAKAGAKKWQKLSREKRAAILHNVGYELEKHRAELLEVMASEAGKTIDQSDPEVSEAIDFAHYYAQRSVELDHIDGASHTPDDVVLITPPWNFPAAIPAGSTLAALASGAATIFKPAKLVARTGALLAEIMFKAGVPGYALHSIQIGERELGQQLIADPRVDRVILTGGYETAVLFRSFRPDLKLLAETSGKNALVITPSADLDLAAKDLAYSAFGHAGQKCSASSIAILVASVATSKRFRRQLQDAVNSLTVDYPTNPEAQMGPIVEPAKGKLLAGLTELDAGESWLIKPRKLDDSGMLWSPGVRENVQPGATSHLVEYFGPVLAIMTASSLEEAVELQNAVDYGLTAGIHSLDPKELSYWAANVQAGNLYINRGITGAIVQRQPFGGWKKSGIGAGSKAGGPNYLFGFGSWSSKPSQADSVISAPLAELLKSSGDESLTRAAKSFQDAKDNYFGKVEDLTGLTKEKNYFRYLPDKSAILRLSESASDSESLKALAAVMLAPWVQVSAAGIPAMVSEASVSKLNLVIESDEDFLDTASKLSGTTRIRWIGEVPEIDQHSVLANPDLALYSGQVTESGQIELLPYFLEQAVSITAHRFGTKVDFADKILN